VGSESRLRRWFGKEHNPERATLVRQGMHLQLAADGAAGLAVLVWIKVSAAAGVALLVLAASYLGCPSGGWSRRGASPTGASRAGRAEGLGGPVGRTGAAVPQHVRSGTEGTDGAAARPLHTLSEAA
jgi:hypothetical protein